MSKIRKSIGFVFLLTLVTFFMFGCKNNTTPVEDIYFNIADEQIVLLKGETLELKDYVVVQPNYASNKSFSLVSENQSILSVDGITIKAEAEGTTKLKVISNDNEIKQDIITVSVKATQTVLNTPDVKYNKDTASFNFNAIPNATSYTIKINGGEPIELGNTTSFALPEDCYNKITVVQVKANSPTYSHAFINSAYSNELKIYQASTVSNVSVNDGVLTFDKVSNAKYKITIGNELLTTTAENTISLKRLNEKFAGLNTVLKVQTLVDDSIKQQGVSYNNSSTVNLPLSILDVTNLSISGTVVSWQNVANATGYEFYVDNVKKYDLNTNNFNLHTLPNYETLFKTNAVNKIKVVPVLKNTKNVASTTKTTEISVQKLNSTAITCDNYDVKWSAVENASTYNIALSKNNETLISASTSATSISLKNREAGNYKLTVQAIAKNEAIENVYYISSSVVDANITKLATLNAEISNYVLNVDNLETNDKVEISIDDIDYSSKFSNNKLDLTNEEFDAGKHIVSFKRYRTTGFIDSDVSTLEFTQLEKIENITITNSKAQVTRSSINNQAEIKLVTTGSKISDIETIGTNYEYNTTVIGENYLPAGDDYKTEVFVLGDGSKTFSYREKVGTNLVVVSNCYAEFDVLPAPSNFQVDKANPVLTFDAVSNKYLIYTVGENTTTQINTNSYNVNLNSGSVSYQVQAIGDGSATLNSVLSSVVNITKLQTPGLKFNNANNTITRQNTNTVGYDGVYKYTHNINNEEATEIDFDEVIDYTVEGTHHFTLQEFAIDNDGSNNNFYLNSNICTLTLTKINNQATISLNSNNQLIIQTNHNAEYALKLVFNCNGTEKTYNLSSADKELNYTYASNKYTIDLIDANYNAVDGDMLNGFNVKVQFIPTHSDDGDSLIASEFSSVSEDFNFTCISETSTILTNIKNQIVITPENHTREYFLRVMINGEQFVSKNSKLVNADESVTLNYTYKNKSYFIDILNNDYDPIITTLGSSFDVKVKYSYNSNGETTDLDSSFTEKQTITFLLDSQIVKDGQTLKIKNVNDNYNYLNYVLIINNSSTLFALNESCELENDYIIIDINYIYNNSSDIVNGVNSIKVLTINTQDNVTTLAKLSEEILIEKASPITINYSKDNTAQNNSAVISFNTYATNYDKQYIVELTDGVMENPIRYTYFDTDAVNGVISFNLDDISIEGTISIKGYVVSLDEYYGTTDLVYVFNSAISNTLSINKIVAPTDVNVADVTLSWQEVAGAVGYEIYEKTDVGYTKISTSLLTKTSYTVAVTKQTDFVIKAISNTNNSTNSSYSQIVTINALPAPRISVEDGRFKVELNYTILTLVLNGVDIVPEITNGERSVDIHLDDLGNGITLVGTTVYVEPELILNYSGTSVIAENLSVKLKVASNIQNSSVYYINSNKAEITAYGLFAPTNIQNITDQNNTVEFISWTNNDKNKLNNQPLNVGYIVKINYNGVDYLTNDENLKYSSSVDSVYDSVITGNQIIFPYGYYNPTKGAFDVVFGAGIYKVSAQTVPISTTGENFCKSTFTTTLYEFEVMSPVSLSVQEGKISWTQNAKATDYLITIYDNETVRLNEKLTATQYDFNSNNNFNLDEGVYKVVVKALSSRADTLNSVESAPLYVYRLPQANSVYIEDGQLFMSAVNIFTKADITFTNANHTTTVTYTNDKATENLTALKVANWQNFTKTLTVDKYSVDVSNLLEGLEYTISIKLYGNTHETLGLLDSSLAEQKFESFKIVKLKTNVTKVSTGVIEFNPANSYVELTDIDVNYAFNGTVQTTNEFFNSVKIYKIAIKSASGEINVYAVDYFNFVDYYNLDKNTLGTTEIDTENYHIFEAESENTNLLCGYVNYTCTNGDIIRFNIYKDNIINLRDYNDLYYYPITESMVNGVNTLTGSSTYTTLNLSSGGSFVVDIYMLGGDSNANVGYLTSNANNVGTFVRYGDNALSTNGGKVEFNNLASQIDNPVYKVVVTPINASSLEIQETIIYLYHTTESDAKQVASRLDINAENAIYLPVQAVEGSDSKLIFDLSKYFAAGNYKVSIRTLAGLGDGQENAQDYLLNAKEPSIEYTYKKLEDTTFTISNGVLQFAQSYIKQDNLFIYYNNYEITLNDGTKDYVYTINKNSDGVSINDATHVVTYVLPSAITIKDTTITITPNKQYNIKIKAISVDNYIVNGTYMQANNVDTTLSFTRSQGVSNVRIENGVLKWFVNDLDNYVSTVVKLKYTENIVIDGGTAYYVDGVYQYHYFEFGDGKYNLETTGSESVNPGINYSVQMYTKGKNNILNSDYSSPVALTRLNSVDANTIVTDIDGHLSWSAVDGASSYELLISGCEPVIVDTNNYDLSLLNLAVGNYSIKLKAIGTNQITSMTSTEAEGFVKLGAVALSSIGISNSNIIWGAVENAQAYKVEFIYTPTIGSIQPALTVTECSVTAPTNISGKFTVYITPIGSGKLINGNTTEFTSSNETPAEVSSVEFDQANSRYVIKVDTTKFFSGDKLQIIYNFTEYTNENPLAEVTIKETLEYQNNTDTYYYNITKIGLYSNLIVQVVRDGTVPSNAKGVDTVNFNLFSYGEGSESNPYRINNAIELLNIPYFKNANYILTASIRMNSVDYNARLNTYNAIISDEFSGVLDGNNFSIFDFNTNTSEATDTIYLTNANNFALFAMLNGAEIKNLTIGEENIQMILLNMFANNNSNVINLSMIATGAKNNTTLNNINIKNLKIKLMADSSNSTTEILSGLTYVSGLVGEAVNTNILNSKVNITTEMAVNFTNDVYLSGAVAKASGTTKLDNCEITFVPLSSTNNIVTFIGGAIANYQGETAKEYGISNSKVEVSISNVKALYVGGLVGFAKHINIESSSTSGSITYQALNDEINIGGLVGVAQSSKIASSGTTVSFTITVSNISNKFIGAIAGRLTVVKSISGEVINCHVNGDYNYKEQTTITTSAVTIGMYTYKDTEVTITKGTN